MSAEEVSGNDLAQALADAYAAAVDSVEEPIRTVPEEFRLLNDKLDELITELRKHRGATQAAVAALARLVGVK